MADGIRTRVRINMKKTAARGWEMSEDTVEVEFSGIGMDVQGEIRNHIERMQAELFIIGVSEAQSRNDAESFGKIDEQAHSR